MADRTKDCGGVCAEIRERLVKAGLLEPNVVRHQPVFDALDKVVFVTKDDLQHLTLEQLQEKHNFL
jgi:hypothetical protein